MRQKLNIPKKIHVGFQERNDTYSKRLAFITYTDEKGKLRQELSWKSWIDNKIAIEDYINNPVNGFVLNRDVNSEFKWDGYSISDWETDFKNRVATIKYDAKKKSIKAIKEKLSKLISGEGKTAMEIELIKASLLDM